MSESEVFMFLGFLLAAYAIVANDAIQTLGTFLSSNSNKPWWLLWLFACSILILVTVSGWWVNEGDIAFGRLEKFPLPKYGFSWIYAIPPLCILVLTYFGIPVSTTFLVLTVFAPGNLGAMLTKSLLGYGVALLLAFFVYKSVVDTMEQRFLKSTNREPTAKWVALQWLSTGFLWSQWLMHDLANIFVYMPRQLSMDLLVFALSIMLALHAVIFYWRGGSIQIIVTSKTNTRDIRSATLVDFIYGIILFLFKEINNIPMSTTWIFLGLLAGRELAMTMNLKHRSLKDTGGLVLSDGRKAVAGLLISIALALVLPVLNSQMTEPGSSVNRSTNVPALHPNVVHTRPPLPDVDSKQLRRANLKMR